MGIVSARERGQSKVREKERGQSKLGEHREHGEHRKHGKDGKFQADYLKYSTCDSKHSFWQPDDSKHFSFTAFMQTV